MATEAGHHASRAYIDQSGNIHLNGASFFNDAEADIADSLEVLNSTSPAELGFIDGVTAGTVTASKALVVGSSKEIGSIGTVTMAEAANIVAGTTTGTKIGTATSQKLGFYNATPVTQPTAPTAALTTITIADAAGTPDYAIQAVTQTTPFGFASGQELISFMYVVQNLQTRVAELASKLATLGLTA